MDAPAPQQRRAVKDITKSATPLVVLTAYTADVARILDAHVDIVLVGDSVGMVLYGYADTLSVTLDMMIAHGTAVVRSSAKALIVVDMPYGSYEQSPDQALANARRVMVETGCSAIKLEGGAEMATTIHHLVQNGVPVMGHIGLMPQSVEKMGGYKIQGRDEPSAQKLLDDAKAIAEAGAFCFVIEGTVEPVAAEITKSVKIPTIGIGASAACDGQVLVITDLLGLTPKPPRFSKAFTHLSPIITEAVKNYAHDVRARVFPGPEHCFPVKPK
jgi:3-methyl-2-oxobutanoate hydroxymethyltransferase